MRCFACSIVTLFSGKCKRITILGLLFAGIASILSMMAFYVWKKRRISREHQLVPGTAENRRKRQDRKRSMINIIMAETIWNGAVTVFDFIMDNLVIINVLLSLVIVFFQRRSPQTVWTWLLLLYLYRSWDLSCILSSAGLPQKQDV